MPHVHRSTDGGRHWQRVDGDNAFPAPLAGPLAMVTTEGTHVVVALDGASFQYLESADGTAYRRVKLAGLPALGHVPTATGGGLFIIRGDGDLYGSPGGRTWHRLLPQ